MGLGSLDPKLVQKMNELDKKYNPVQQQLTALQDIASMVHELLNVADDTKTETSQLKAIGAVLDDSRQQLIELNKKEAPESPDYAKPVVDAVNKLSREITAQLGKIDVKPNVKVQASPVNLPAPQVKVDAPDFSKVEKILKTDIPKAFEKAIKAIPKTDIKIPAQTNYTDKFDEMLEWLKSIDTATRLKPVNPPATAGAGGDGAINDGVSSTIKATVFDYTNSNPLGVVLRDTNGDYVSVGGGTQYADGAARGTATGTIAMGDDGTNIQSIKTDSSGVLAIQDNGGTISIDDGAGSITVDGTVAVTGVATNAAQTDKSQFTKITDGTDTALITAAGEQNVLATAQPGVDIGDVTINNASGASAVNIQDGGNSITVDGAVTTSGTVTEANSAAILSSTQLIDDAIVADNAGFTDGTTKLDMAGYIYDEVAGTALTENDAAAARINVNRAQVQTIEDGVTRGRYATVSAANALKVDNSGVTQPVSGTVAISTALALDATVATTNTEIGIVTETAPASDTASSGLNGRLQRIAQRLTSLIALLPTSLGQKTMANSLAVVLPSDQSSIPVTLASTTVTGTVTTKETRSATNTTATVAGSASVVTLIASNANRLGATVYNNSSAVLYLKLGATASTSDFTAVLQALTSSVGGYYEVPFGYTGIITGLWASATGNARVGELT